jgi:hypothetical protein
MRCLVHMPPRNAMLDQGIKQGSTMYCMVHGHGRLPASLFRGFSKKELSKLQVNFKV